MPGIAPILGDAIEGEARDVGKVMAGMVPRSQTGQPWAPPCVLLSGGETTVTVRGQGRGGRNVEFLLSLGDRAGGPSGVYAIAGDTDGVDGRRKSPARSSRRTAWRAPGARHQPEAALADNDGHGFFGALGERS